MSISTRRRILSLRRAALGATILLRGRAQAGAWALHEILRLGPTLLRNSSLHGPVAKSFRAAGKQVWLTIDDGPDPDQTPLLLDLLARHGAKASFFVVGKNVESNRALCHRILADGHTLENHTQSHPSATFWAMPCCAVQEEIEHCSHAIRVATGECPTWFRSPAGLTSSCVHPAAARAWLRLAGWSADGRDGIPGSTPHAVAKRILAGVRRGAILLMHEGPGRRSTEVLDLLLQGLSAGGFQCVIPNPADVE